MHNDDYYRKIAERKFSFKWAFSVGLIWALVQFAVSESFHQVGMMGDVDVLYEISDAVAWPAGHIYRDVEIELYKEALRELESTAEEREAWEALIIRFSDPNDDEAYDVLWDIFEAHSKEPPYVDTVTEYSIYIGVCLFWGMFFGFLLAWVKFVRQGL